MYKIKFLKEEKLTKKGTKITKGECQPQNRNHPGEIRIYSGHNDKLRTLVHEVIHCYLFEKSKKGYKSRLIDQLNDDESFVDGLAVEISKVIKNNKKELQKEVNK